MARLAIGKPNQTQRKYQVMENRSTIIYLDWNVISSLAAGENDLLLSKLQQTIANGVVFVPYSYAHVLEIANITDSPTNKKADIVKANLSFLSDLSNDFQIKVADDESCAYLEKRPIRELYLAAQFIKLFLELPFPQDEKPDLQEIQAHRLQYGLDPNILNNIPPDQIINRIDEVLTSDENRRKFPNNGVIGKTIKDMYEANASSANALISELGVVSGIGTNMVLVYTYLDALGYWPDSGKKNAARSQFIDLNHKTTAIYADVYVTDDLKHKMKTLATYSFFGIKQSVISSTELLAWLEGLP